MSEIKPWKTFRHKEKAVTEFNVTDLCPRKEKLIVKRAELHVGTIEIPDNVRDSVPYGTVLRAHPDSDVKDGDTVFFAHYAGAEFTVGGVKVLMMSEDDLLAVVPA